MKNWVQAGHVVTLAAPTGGVKSGDPVLVNNIFGIAATDALEAADVECAVTGVFDLPSTGAFNQGQAAYWDVSAAKVVSVASTNFLIGVALAAVGGGGTSCRVRLNGAATFAAA